MGHIISRVSGGCVALIVIASCLATPGAVQAQTELDELSAADAVKPGTNRLFFAPTARTLPAGASELGAYQVLAPYYSYAFHDRFMLGLGTPLLPEVFGRFWYLAPKASLVLSRLVSIAGGGLVILDLGSQPFSGQNVAESFYWGVITFGSPRAGVTVGFASDVGRLDGLPDSNLLIVGGELELPVRAKDDDDVGLRLIAESYMSLPGGDYYTVSDASLHLVGLRFTAGRAALEVVEGFEFLNGDLELWTKMPLVNFSFLF